MNQIERAARNRNIKHLAQEGKTADELAEIFSMKRSRVLMILRSYKVKPGRVSHSLECDMARKIIEELEIGTKQSAIAKKLGVSRQYVNQVKIKYEMKN